MLRMEAGDSPNSLVVQISPSTDRSEIIVMLAKSVSNGIACRTIKNMVKRLGHRLPMTLVDARVIDLFLTERTMGVALFFDWILNANPPRLLLDGVTDE